MRYKHTVSAKFIFRPNRFLALVELNGETETVHVKNTGRCKVLLLPGCEVILDKSGNPARKTQYDLIAVYKSGLGKYRQSGCKFRSKGMAGKQARVVSGRSADSAGIHLWEIPCGFLSGVRGRKILMEVKGSTLEIDGVGYFSRTRRRSGA